MMILTIKILMIQMKTKLMMNLVLHKKLLKEINLNKVDFSEAKFHNNKENQTIKIIKINQTINNKEVNQIINNKEVNHTSTTTTITTNINKEENLISITITSTNKEENHILEEITTESHISITTTRTSTKTRTKISKKNIELIFKSFVFIDQIFILIF